jgi:hypothetical protein
LIVLDDWGLTALSAQDCADLLKILGQACEDYEESFRRFE